MLTLLRQFHAMMLCHYVKRQRFELFKKALYKYLLLCMFCTEETFLQDFLVILKRMFHND